MKQHTRNLIWKFAAVAVVVMVLYNFFGYFLEDVKIVPVNAWFIAPFLLLLLSIAVMPFINRHWWEKNYPLWRIHWDSLSFSIMYSRFTIFRVFS